MLRGIWGDDKRYKETYWSKFASDIYCCGDGARYDADGDIWISGRVDDTLNISGHLISTAEVEAKLGNHHLVSESAAIGVNDDITGQKLLAFVVLVDKVPKSDYNAIVAELKNHIGKTIGSIAKPKDIIIVPDLPKTRSGKILRRLLRSVYEDQDLGDTSTLADTSVLKPIIDSIEKSHVIDLKNIGNKKR
jgi:acetyl-CoA synthetase